MRFDQSLILAVNPGTRYLGLAIFHGNQLIDWRVKIIKGKWSSKKLQKVLSIVDGIIDRYRPDHLAIKHVHPSRSSKNLNALVEGIEKLALRNKHPVHRYSIKQMERFLCGEKRKNKKNLAQAVAAQYPELYSELDTEFPELLDPNRKRKNPYHMRMFEAVALGAMCTNELNNF